MKYIYILFAIIITIGAYLYGSDRNSRYDIKAAEVFALKDSMRIHDQKRDSIVKAFRIRSMSDSLKVAYLEQIVGKVPDMINNVKKKYNEKRNHINSLPVDEQVGYLADWLSKEDSL